MNYTLDEAERLAYVYPTPENLSIFLEAQYECIQELTEEDWQGQCEDQTERAKTAEDRADILEEDLQNMETERDEFRMDLEECQRQQQSTVALCSQAADALHLLGLLPDLVAQLREVS